VTKGVSGDPALGALYFSGSGVSDEDPDDVTDRIDWKAVE
jgi:hypothetical protein